MNYCVVVNYGIRAQYCKYDFLRGVILTFDIDQATTFTKKEEAELFLANAKYYFSDENTGSQFKIYLADKKDIISGVKKEKKYKFAVKQKPAVLSKRYFFHYYLNGDNLLTPNKNDRTLFSSKEEAKKALKSFRYMYGYRDVKFVYVKVPVK